MVDFKLDGIFEHRVQTDVIFKLRCTKDGVPYTDANYSVITFLRGKEEVKGDVTFHAGTYTLKYFPRIIGKYEIHIKINNQWLYKDSDAIINIVDQLEKKYVDLSFELDGPVLEGNMKAGNSYSLYIYVKNSDSQPHNVKSDEFQVHYGKGYTLQKLAPSLISTGKYQVDLYSDVPGTFPVDVFFEGKSVLREAFNVKFVSSSDPKNTKACQVPTNMVPVGQESSFFIQSRNKNDLNNTCGGDIYEVNCTGPMEIPDLSIRDTRDGKYHVTFTPPASGIYTFNITLNGSPIGNSPVNISAVKK